MNISKKIKEMQGDLNKYPALENNEGPFDLEGMTILMLNDDGILGPGKIIDENNEYLDFMFYSKEGPIFSLSIIKEHICGLSIVHKKKEDKESAGGNVGISKALYQ